MSLTNWAVGYGSSTFTQRSITDMLCERWSAIATSGRRPHCTFLTWLLLSIPWKKNYEDVYEGSSSAPAASSLRHVGSQNFSAQLVHTENTHSHIIKNDFSGSPSSQVCQKDPRLDRVPKNRTHRAGAAGRGMVQSWRRTKHFSEESLILAEKSYYILKFYSCCPVWHDFT